MEIPDSPWTFLFYFLKFVNIFTKYERVYILKEVKELNLSQKERMLLEDQKSHEELCIKKYNHAANQAKDPQLKSLFQSLEQQERKHLDTINQLLKGQMPMMNQQGQNQQNQQNQQGQQNQQSQQNQMTSQSQSNMQNYSQNNSSMHSDADLCNDLLTTEKYVSSTYNTAIFEFRDPNIRQILNHIQKEEQEHGEMLFNYMQKNGMYNVK